jgi:hypothetical protein
MPLIIFISGSVVSQLYLPLSKLHFSVALAEEIKLENSGARTETTLETRTFRASGKLPEELFAEVDNIQQKIKTGGWFLGGFLGLIFCIKLINLSKRKKQLEYTADKGICFSCARCFSYCPFEQARTTPLKGISILNEF